MKFCIAWDKDNLANKLNADIKDVLEDIRVLELNCTVPWEEYFWEQHSVGEFLEKVIELEITEFIIIPYESIDDGFKYLQITRIE